MTVTEVDRTSPSTAAARTPPARRRSRAYLNNDLVIKKANLRGIVAIHPGWGFAAEDDSFPRKCEDAGIIFIGPSQMAMRMLGNKVEVRKLAKRLGVPVVPGSEGAVDVPTARKVAAELGLPIMLKAEGGGGGRGIYEVYNQDDLESAFAKASAMAQASFGNPRLYVEKLLTSVRHIEIQVIADRYGNVFAFDERDCTVQRNHQKLIEITPSPWPGMTEELRERLKNTPPPWSRRSATTRSARSSSWWTAKATPTSSRSTPGCRWSTASPSALRVDLVEEQIAIAFGAKLRLNKQNTRPLLWSLQCRINCEDPQGGFSPNAA
jgi:pyruvate carboxylase